MKSLCPPMTHRVRRSTGEKLHRFFSTASPYLQRMTPTPGATIANTASPSASSTSIPRGDSHTNPSHHATFGATASHQSQSDANPLPFEPFENEETDSSQSVFSPWCKSFTDLDEVHPKLVKALKQNNITRPSQIQADSYREISRMKDVILSAETGSGKTLAYLLPIVNRLYYLHDAHAQNSMGGNGNVASGKGSSGSVYRQRRPAVILAPTADLCMQIVHQLLELDRDEKRCVVQVLGESWASWCGGGLTGKALGPEGTAFELESSMTRNERENNKQFSGDTNNSNTSNNKSSTSSLFSDSLQSSTETHVGQKLEKNFFAAPRIRWGAADIIITTPVKFAAELHHLPNPDDPITVSGTDSMLSQTGFLCSPGTVVMDEADLLFHGATRTYIYDIFAKLRPRLKIRQPEEQRQRAKQLTPTQFVFAAATMVHIGPLSVGNMLIERFCNGVTVKTEGCHQIPSSVQMRWVNEASDDWHERVEQLVRLLKREMVNDSAASSSFSKGGNGSGADKRFGRTIIFVNSSFNARVLREFLLSKNWPVTSFMKGKFGKMGPRMRDARAFALDEVQFLVATDLGGRGVDWPNVDHVVNFELPRDTVTFVHRCGRTGRMGKPGKVTNFVAKADKSLADRIRGSLSNLETAFSVKRSFRKMRRRNAAEEGGDGEELTSFADDGIVKWAPKQEGTLIGWTDLEDEEDEKNGLNGENGDDEVESSESGKIFDRMRRNLLKMTEDDEPEKGATSWSNMQQTPGDLPDAPAMPLWNRSADGKSNPKKPRKLRQEGQKSVLRNLDDDVKL